MSAVALTDCRIVGFQRVQKVCSTAQTACIRGISLLAVPECWSDLRQMQMRSCLKSSATVLEMVRNGPQVFLIQQPFGVATAAKT